MITIQQAASRLVSQFFHDLQLGLESPATFEQEYGEDNILELKVEFTEYGGGPSPYDPEYQFHLVDFDFYNPTWVNPEILGISREDFKY